MEGCQAADLVRKRHWVWQTMQHQQLKAGILMADWRWKLMLRSVVAVSVRFGDVLGKVMGMTV